MPALRPEPDSATADDERALLVGTGALLLLLSVGAAVLVANSFAYAPGGVGGGGLLPRFTSNLAAVVVVLGALKLSRVHRSHDRWEVAILLGLIALLGAVTRIVVQASTGVYFEPTPRTQLIEVLGGTLSVGVVSVLVFGSVVSRRRLRRGLESAAQAKIRIELALAALQNEEVRVRREVAEGLHGSLQQRLVLVVARIDRLTDRLGTGSVTDDDVAALREIREQLDDIREGDVRETSRMLYPDGLEVGMVPAVRSLLGRMPTDIATKLVVSDEVRRLDDPVSPVLTQSERLLAVRVVEEAVTNALRHGDARSLHVVIGLDDDRLAVVVTDDGSGFDTSQPQRASGTARLGDRLTLIGGKLELTSALGSGTRVDARVPVGALYDL